MEYVTDDQVLKILSEFKKNKTTLVEWETPLLQRLGYPLAHQSDLLFLVPDEQINEARHIAVAFGLRDDNKPPSYMTEHAQKSYRYIYGESSHKFVLVPISWTGIQQKELVAVDLATAVSFMDSASKADLASVIGYSMFDMSYEGGYMPTPEDLEHLDAAEKKKMAEKDALEMENALSSIRQWQFMEETDNRETLDIDVEVAMDNAKPNELRPHLVQLLREVDQRFMISDLKLFFVPKNDQWDLRVPIETLARGTLGLPRRFSILCPGDGSTRPQSVVKFNSDVRDIVYLLHWLQDHGKKIDFINYDAASSERLYDAVRQMRANWVSKGEETTVQMLDIALEESDKATLIE
ncbi:hypothetical protein FCOIX_788 [Fusarium coicis]|nr:hypothetical protein FCOIX_788 [Fusarium coicis]